jgi:hypothetical protein
MAYKISTRNVFATSSIGTTGGTSLSDPIDLRDISSIGTFSLAVIAKPLGAAATAGTTSWTYQCAQARDGIYTKPAGAGTVGTGIGTAGSSDIYSFTPILSPFIKFQVIAGTGGGVIDAFLNVR